MSAASPKTTKARTDDRRRHEQWAIAGVLLVAVFAVCLVAFLPGVIKYDSNQMILQARSGDLNDSWSPIWSVLLRGWLELGLSLSLMFAVQTALMIAGVFALARHALPPAWAGLATAVIILWPPTFAIMSTLSRDMFFFAFMFLSLAALASAVRAPVSPARERRAWVGAALLLAFLAFLWRQNGLVLVMVVAATGFMVLRAPGEPLWSRWRPTREGLAVAGVAVVASVASFGVSQVANRVIGVERVHQERFLYIYDLAAISQETGENQFDASFVRQPTEWNAQIYGQANIEERFDWGNVITLWNGLKQVRYVGLTEAEHAAQASNVQRMWREAILSNPLTYLEVRARVSASSLGLTQRPDDSYPFNERDHRPFGLVDFGEPPRYSNRNRQARDYIGAFAGRDAVIPLDIVLVYLLLGLACGAYLWRRRPRDRVLVFAILAIQWLSFAFFFLAAMAASYRYSAFVAPLSIVLAAWVIAQLVVNRTGRASR